MKRRNFLQKLSLAAIPITLGGVPIKLMADNSLTRMAAQSTNDRVLIILQMLGGNDGLNTIIPITNYDQYYSVRANIAIPLTNSSRKVILLDNTLPADSKVGLHPDMIGMKDLYDRGRMTVVQGVSYLNNSGSHFRGRDINFMGGSFNDYFSSGWVGRYLEQEFAPKVYPADFPNPDMQDPLAIEMGSEVSLLFHQSNDIPVSISINDPEGFNDLVNGLEGFQDQGIDPRGYPPVALTNSPYGKELSWILGLEGKSKDYAQRMYDVYKASSPSSITYPETYPLNTPAGSLHNPLTPQLQLIARLLDGGGAGQGVKTKVFLVKVGGFDTHASQVETYDPTMGTHAALMFHISAAMQAFQDDLKARGLEDRVLTVTTSEFGRRIHSNGSYGTDHGTGGPVYIFGKGVQPGVVGKIPDLTQDNVELQYDYRQVYANLLKDWMLVPEATITDDVFFKDFLSGPKEDGTGNYEPLPLAEQVISGVQNTFLNDHFSLSDCYPNPAKESATIGYRVSASNLVTMNLMDTKGKILKNVVNEQKEAGDHYAQVFVGDLTPGVYIYEIRTGHFKDSKRLVVAR